MHRKPEVELPPLDTELETTLRNLRKVNGAESETIGNQRERMQPIPEEAETERPKRQITMEGFWRPVIQDEYSVVRQLAIEANNFELKPSLITMAQQPQFTKHPSEDLNEHMGRFMRMANTIKLNGVKPEVIKL